MAEQSEVELVLPRQARQAIAFWKTNPMLPTSYVKIDNKTGEVTINVAGMEKAAWLITRAIGPEYVWDFLGDTFDIKGNIGFKADLQRLCIERVPGYGFEFLEVTNERVTARIKVNGAWKPPLTKRIDDTDIQTYKKANEDNYTKKPNRMLEARVTTELVDLYAKGVIRGLIRAGASDLTAYYTDQGEEPTGELGAGTGGEAPTAPGPPPRSTAPDGSTIPEALREPEVDDEMRQALRERIDSLDDTPKAALIDVWREFRAPNLKGHQFTRAHGALLWRLIDELSPSAAAAPAADDDASGSTSDAAEPSTTPPHPPEAAANVDPDAPLDVVDKAQQTLIPDPGAPF